MRKLSAGAAVAIFLLGVAVSLPAHSDRAMFHPTRPHFGQFHHQHRVLVFVGAPIFWAWYDASADGYDAAITEGSSYIPSTNAPYASPPVSYLYFCAESNAYYPYVTECLDGWDMVVPMPPS